MSGALGLPLPMLPQVRDAGGCGCGGGQGIRTPLQVYNRAGLGAVQYRIGDQASFKATLLTRLSAADYPALAALTTRDDQDATIALLDAAATMGDVLTFYQERIANEAWLRTATEWRSLAAMGRLTGYEPSPGLAATAYLAFSLAEGAGSPVEALIPAGTRVQSVPAAGQLPQTFETSADFTARPEWNAMPVVTSQQQPDFTPWTASVLLQGIATQVRPGDTLLLVSAGGGIATPMDAVAVTADPAAMTTRVDFTVTPPPWPGWTPPVLTAAPPLVPSPAPLSAARLLGSVFAQAWNGADLLSYVHGMQWAIGDVTAAVAYLAGPGGPAPALYRLRQHAAVFGHNAPVYATLPASLTSSGAVVGTGNYISQSGVPEIVQANVTGVTVANATIVGPGLAQNAPLPAGAVAAGTVLVSGSIAGVIAAPSTAAPYPTAWTDQNTTLDETWSGGSHTGGATGIQLDHVYSGIGTSGFAVLTDSAAGTQGVFQVSAVGEVSAQAFTLTGKVTTLGLTPLADQPGLAKFTRRGTSVLLDSAALALAPLPVTTAVSGLVLVLPRLYLGLQPQQYVAVSGLCSDPAGVAASELARIATVVMRGNLTVLTLQAPLAHSYVPGSVAVNANVVVATNGMSVSETLGSGNAALPFQAFFLRQPPLTFTADASGAGPVSTLQVRVSGVLWSEVASLYGAGPHDQVFVTWRADDGSTHLMFGDGATGARLPTGSGNVTASYRTGIGSAGVQDAGAVSLLTTRPFGVRTVTNPVATTDAADPDTPAMLRQTAPLHVLTLDRVVSLEDYQNYALAYPGITKALASWRWSGRGRTVVLTLAGSASAPLDPAGPLAQSLLAALLGIGDPRVSVALAPYAQVPFTVSLAVKTDPALVRATVLSAIQSALQAAFSLAERGFGQPVLASEVVACAQGVTGVVGCDLVAFARPTTSATPGVTVPWMLQAAAPAPGQTDPPPAEILVLDQQPVPFSVLP